MYYPHSAKPRRNRGFIHGSSAAIDWSNSLANGLVGVYLPGITVGRNLAGTGGNLLQKGTSNQGSRFGTTSEGAALRNVQTGAGGAGTGLAGSQIPSAFKGTSTSVYFRGAVPYSGGAAGGTFAAVDNGGFGTTSAAYGLISNGNTTGVVVCWNNNGTFTNFTATSAISAGPVYGLLATFSAGGTVFLYVNGSQFSSASFGAGPLSYTGASEISVGAGPGSSRDAGAATNMAAFWNRALSPYEAMALQTDPYQFFIFPEDVVAAQLGALAARSASLSATIAALSNSAAGQVIVSGQL